MTKRSEVLAGGPAAYFADGARPVAFEGMPRHAVVASEIVRTREIRPLDDRHPARRCGVSTPGSPRGLRHAHRVRRLTLQELQEPDGRALHFTPWGLGPAMTPEASAVFLQELVAEADLCDAVPDSVRSEYERLRTVFAHGVLCYDAFTLVDAAVSFALELALGERFVEHYGGQVPFITRSGPVIVVAERFDDVYEARNGGAAKGGPHVRLVLGPDDDMEFRGTFRDLMKWARRVGHFRGQRSRRFEDLLVEIRNHRAHPRGYSLHGPTDVAWSVRDAGELINRLWGVDTPGGRRYPTPIAREVLIVGRSSQSRSGMRLSAWQTDKEDDDWHWLVLRAVGHDRELLDVDFDHDVTEFPTEVLFGPARARAVDEWLATTSPTRDSVDVLDRSFVIPVRTQGWVAPVRHERLATYEDSGELWLLAVADSPFDLIGHVRHRDEATLTDLACDLCGVTEVALGDKAMIEARLRGEGHRSLS